MAFPALAWLLTGALVIGGGGAAVVASVPEGSAARVVRVIDGDTFDAVVDGNQQRIRLLNVDTPETKDPDEAVQCLGPEASEHLATLLHPGDLVRLTYDQQRYDRYGRVLAGVHKDDLLINSEIAARGLGVAKLYEPNERYYPEVLAAQQDAQRRQVGLYAPDVACTLPGRVAAVEQSLAGPGSPVSPDAMDTESARDAAAAASAAALARWFDVPHTGLSWEVFDPAQRAALRQRAEKVEQAMRSASSDWTARASSARSAAADAAAAAERARAESDRRAREAATAQRRADAAARAEQRRLDAAADASASSSTSGSSSSTSSSSRSSSTSGAAPGYHGPRCYEPGGKVWHPC
jgi:micrococcal nuclease